MDNHVYGGADHLLYVQIEGRVIEWVEAGATLELMGGFNLMSDPTDGGS